jgi:hypothetical protein
VQSKPWDQLQLPEKVEQLHHELEELIRVERINVDARAAMRRDLETRMAAMEEAQRQILSRLTRLESTLFPSTAAQR